VGFLTSEKVEKGFQEREKVVRVIKEGGPADLVIKNGSLVNVLTDEVLDRDVAVENGRVARVAADLDRYAEKADLVVDAEGLYLTPGFVDAHLHIESSMLAPSKFAELMAGKGVTAAFYDPHEIANVSGLKGVRWMYNQIERSPFNGFLTVPSCIPASTPELETTGASFGREEIDEALGWEGTAALGEMMNYPGVINGDPETVEKLKLARAHGLPIEGHASGLVGEELDCYAAMGIDSDHEAVTKEEGMERARKGFWTLVREGSGWADLTEVVRALTETDISPNRFCLVTDDRDPIDLLEEGGVDHTLRRGIEEGLEPVTAIRLATLNPATRFGLDHELGAIAPGRRADINLIRNLETLEVEATFLGGQSVEEIDWPKDRGSELTGKLEIAPNLAPELFRLSEGERDYGIKVHQNDIMTEKLDLDGYEAGDSSLDRCAVLERHNGTGNVGRALVEGFGLADGAMASTVAHDSHNMIVLGSNEEDMAVAARHLEQTGGGQAVARNREIVASVELPIAGLMSNQDPEELAESLERVQKAVSAIGARLPQPMMILTSLALAVIPEVRLTDKGLVDVNKQEIVH